MTIHLQMIVIVNNKTGELLLDEVFNKSEIKYLTKKIAKVFKIDIRSLSPSLIFGQELTASFVSDWKPNEIDDIVEDINFIVSKSVEKDWGKNLK